MNIEVIKKENHSVSEWSGGKTTELYIYPKTSKYSDRNFMWRISAAVVELEESTFTNLPGFSREIMVTAGETVLDHEGRYKVTLKPFEKDSFMGDWITKSYGKASDFNLMTSEKCSGDICSFYIKSRDKTIVELNSHKGESSKLAEYFYIIGGDAQMCLEEGNFYLSQKDLFCVNYEARDKKAKLVILNQSSNDIRLIKTEVFRR